MVAHLVENLVAKAIQEGLAAILVDKPADKGDAAAAADPAPRRKLSSSLIEAGNTDTVEMFLDDDK